MCLCLYTVLTPHSVSLLHSIFLPGSPPPSTSLLSLSSSLFFAQVVSLWEEVPGMLIQPYISVKISMNKLTF